jgi:hypothetical protein
MQVVKVIGRAGPVIEFFKAHKEDLLDGKVTLKEVLDDLNELAKILADIAKAQPEAK